MEVEPEFQGASAERGAVIIVVFESHQLFAAADAVSRLVDNH
jgi:uncharacterized protein (DUF2141 family)